MGKKSISGNHDYRGKYRFPHRIEEQKMSKDLEREIKSLRDQLENLKKFYKSVVDAQVSVFKFLMRVEERVKSIEQKTRIK
jgi:hypothetical protein